MSDSQTLEAILSELKKVNKKLDELNTATAGIERAVYDTAP